MCGELKFSVSQYSYRGILFTSSIATSLIVLYSDGTGVVPKVNRKQRKDSLSTIDMQVGAVLVFVWIRR